MNKMISWARKRIAFIITGILAAGAFLIAHLYFKGSILQDRDSWIFWIASMSALFITAYRRDALSENSDKKFFSQNMEREWKKMLYLIGGLTIFYFLIRYMNYPISPWNENGYYDDAAWDVYYMRRYVQSALPQVQVVMYDDFVLGNVRELLFGWYLLPFFQILGYNALILNFACAVLGYIAVIFTALTARRLFKSYDLALLAGMLLTLNPYHFAHTYMGERYAMAPTLMIISIYFITCCATQEKSAAKAGLAGVFTALCAGSGKTGKQYVYGIIAAAVLYILFNLKRLKIKSVHEIKEKFSLPAWFLGGFLIGFTPFLAFIAAFPNVYDSREGELIKNFFKNFSNGGFSLLLSNMQNFLAAVFTSKGDGKQYMAGYPLISPWHSGLVFAGMTAAFIRKRYDIFIMCLLPAASLVIVPFYDYRLYISTPVWILAVVYTVDVILKINADRSKYIRITAIGVILVMITAGAATGFRDMVKVTSNPRSQYLNRRNDVGAMRMIQDAIIGINPPSAKMKRDEFKRKDISRPLLKNYLIAPESAFGVAALYLMDFPKENVSYLASKTWYNAEPPEAIIEYTINNLEKFTDYSKDLRVIIQQGEKISDVLSAVESAEHYGQAGKYSEELDGVNNLIYILDIPKENVEAFNTAVINVLRNNQ
ncbi:MAG: glycosyltransferase family 39 protein [Clostridiales bacterium]|jgi:hypothetical protein|nr:glycosyltransferase family 39 protein [Clostridiales bacterium]